MRRRASARACHEIPATSAAIDGGIVVPAGAARAPFHRFAAPDNYIAHLRVWAMLMRRRLGNNRGAIPRRGAGMGHLGRIGGCHGSDLPARPAGARRRAADRHDRRGALRAILLLRPRGILGEARLAPPRQAIREAGARSGFASRQGLALCGLEPGGILSNLVGAARSGPRAGPSRSRRPSAAGERRDRRARLAKTSGIALNVM